MTRPDAALVRSSRRRGRPHGRRLGAALPLALGAVLLAGCSDGGDGDEAGEEAGASTGVPAHYADGISEGRERYPEIGTTGMGDFQWECPLEDSIEVDGEEHDNVLTTVFFGPMEDVYLVQCDFYRPFSVNLSYAQADSDEAFEALEALEAATGAVDQVGNEQTEETVTVGERDFVVVRIEYPTNPAAAFNVVAHHLDPETRSRTTLDVSGSSDGLSEDYDARDAAEDLAAILSSH